MRAMYLALTLLLSCPLAADPYMGIGGLTLPPADQLADFAQTLQDAGLNHVQCRIPTGDPDVRERVAFLHQRGFTVFGYASAFLGIREERDDFQIRADGSVKTGTVCPRSERRIAEMIELTNAVADTGADGMLWDFITVESRTMEACFCPDCVAAFNEAAGTDYAREELVAALDRDPAALEVWKRVRRDSTNEAMRRVAEAAHQHRPDLKVGGYVIAPENTLGMDTEGLSHILDVLAPMVYQGHRRADVGWMREKLGMFTALTGDAEIIECVDTGFWVDQPAEELINTCWDCHRAGIDGWALWPFGTVSQADLVAVAGVPMLARRYHQPLREGRAQQARAGLREVLAEAREAIMAHGGQGEREALAELFDGDRPAGELAVALERWRQLPTDDEAAGAVARVLHLRGQAEEHRLHESDRHFRAGGYEVIWSDVAREVSVRGEGWEATQDHLALNIDELRFDGLIGDASTDPHSLGLIRTRVSGWFDPWGSRADVTVRQPADNLVEITSVCASNDCRLGRTWMVRAGEPWMAVDVFVENTGDEARDGRLWIWNGVGIPGFLEAHGHEPWRDDRAEVLEANILLLRDEGRFVAIGADPALWTIPAPGGGVSNLFHELELAPGERFTTRLYLAFGDDADAAWPQVLERYPREF
ncbi:MAG: hypothetical protein U9R79_14350 [Armatimonadota bacterium]|nr:hypothetical protein [Armatimonadota bacterium]